MLVATDPVPAANPTRDRGAETRREVARERSRQRLTYVRITAVASVLLMLSTFMTWVVHPGAAAKPGHPDQLQLVAVGHSMGVTVVPAGVLTLILGALILVESRWMTRGDRLAAWTTLSTSLIAFVVIVAELIHLDLAERHWLDAHVVANTVFDDADGIGLGIRVAFFVALALVTTTGVFTSRVYGSWRDAPPAPWLTSNGRATDTGGEAPEA